MYFILLNHFEALEDIYAKIDQKFRMTVRNFFINSVGPRFGDLPMISWTKLRRKILNDYQVLSSWKNITKK